MTDLFRCPLHTRSSLGCCPLFWCPLLFLPFCNISPLSVLRPSGFTLLSSGFSSYSVSLFSPSRSFLCPHSASLSAAPSRLPTSVFLKNRCSNAHLEDATNHANTGNKPQDASSGAAQGLNELGATGAITRQISSPPHILGCGPLIISHILGILATSVPGFAGIPCTEAKRLVVAALESCRSSEVEYGGGLNGNVIFEEVRRGRRDARLREEGSWTRRQKNEKFQQAGHSHPSGSVPDLSLSHRKIDSDSSEVTGGRLAEHRRWSAV